MIALKLAFRNLMGAGLRTWLNVAVLSFSYVIIIWQQGVLEGWNLQARRDMIDWEIGGGVYWHEAYDPYDMFTLTDSHGTVPGPLQNDIQEGSLTPVLDSHWSRNSGRRCLSSVNRTSPSASGCRFSQTKTCEGSSYVTR